MADFDKGPILAQARTSIDPRETATSLHDRLAVLGGQLLAPTLKDLAAGTATEAEQDDTLATTCRKFTRTDGTVDPSMMTAEEIDRRVRALLPWPGVTCPIGETTVKILATTLEPTEQELQDALTLPCANQTTLHITKLLPPGKSPMTGAEFERGI